jgi:hypothetical protein
MCIFAQPIDDVSKTKIFVRSLDDGTRQLVVYENNVVYKDFGNNAMILPFPRDNKDGKDVLLLDLSEYEGNFFQDAYASFPQKDTEYYSSGFTFGSTENSNWLPVKRVGSYKVSVANSLYELDYMNPLFQLSSDVKKTLAKQYSKNFGFVICMFNASLKAHPIAYISDTLPKGTMFVPTRHEHGDDKPAKFDHTVYISGCDCEFSYPGIDTDVTNRDCIQWDMIKGVKLQQCKKIYRFIMKGKFPNKDLTV